MVRPTTGLPACCRSAATVEESTPPDMATATRPICVSLLSGKVSNCVCVVIYFRNLSSHFYFRAFGQFAVRGGEFTKLCDGCRNYFDGVVDLGHCGVASEAEADAGTRFFRRKSDGGEHVRWL